MSILRPLSRCLIGSCCAILLGTAPRAQTGSCYDWSSIDTWLNNLVRALSLDGAAVSISRENQEIYRKFVGKYDANTVIPIASATKWISGALIMTLVDQNKLSLDDKVSKYIPAFRGKKGDITIRQCFAHTSGLPGESNLITDARLTLEQAAAGIATGEALLYDPGTTLHYGGVSMHVAGRVAEIVSGKDWELLLRDNLTGPMGITTIDYQGLGTTKNYQIAAGARSSLGDYRTFLQMLLNEGMHGTKRILSKAAIAEMFKDQTGNATIKYTPHPDGRRYGVGVWRDRVAADGEVLQASSQGVFGFSPWIDFERDTIGIVYVRSFLWFLQQRVENLQAWTRANMHWAGTTCFGTASPSCHGSAKIRTNRIPARGNGPFYFECSNAPPQSAGFLLVNRAAQTPPLRLFEGWIHVALAPAPITYLIASDAAGVARVPAPIDGFRLGIQLYSQFAFVPLSCPRKDVFATTPGLRITVR